MACFAIYLVLCLLSTIALNSVFRSPAQRWYAKPIVMQIALVPVSYMIFMIWYAWQFDAIVRGPRPMFHVLNTEENRDPVFGLPNWHTGFETSDSLGRRIYLDGERNLLVMAVSPPTTRLYYVATPEETHFYPDTADEFTVAVTTDALMIYSQGELISETVLPAGFADQFVRLWLTTHEPRYEDFGAALKARGLDIDVPLPLSSRAENQSNKTRGQNGMPQR